MNFTTVETSLKVSRRDHLFRQNRKEIRWRRKKDNLRPEVLNTKEGSEGKAWGGHSVESHSPGILCIVMCFAVSVRFTPSSFLHLLLSRSQQFLYFIFDCLWITDIEEKSEEWDVNEQRGEKAFQDKTFEFLFWVFCRNEIVFLHFSLFLRLDSPVFSDSQGMSCLVNG